MTVSCPDCRSVFRVDPAKVPATGVRARCSVCGGVIAIAGGTLPVSVTPASLGAVQPGSAAVGRPAQLAPKRPYTPSAARAVSSPPAAAAMMTPPAPSRVAPLPFRRPTPMQSPAVSAAHPTANTADAGTATMTSPTAGAQEESAGSPRVGTAPLTPATTMATPRRAINPFLNADPGQRARRLARALVSDLVAYHPQKREEGLRDGTLRQLFREDIKKSYEEYVEQVGREVAESSPHFQEALNEILGSGRKLF